MTINQDRLMKVLLLAGMEDYCALYQTLGEIHTTESGEQHFATLVVDRWPACLFDKR